MFHDFDKFFDSIDITILIQKALEVNFPIIDLLMTMLQHTAPRIIQRGGFCSRPIITNTSILAGCKHSVALTRVLFLSGMNSLCVQHPLAAPKLYVDDTAMLTAGNNEEATQAMWLNILDFVNLSQALGLKLSTKGVIVAKLPSAARALVKELAQKGITYNTADTTRDLGIDFSFSHKPKVRKTTLKHIIKKTKNMLNKIKKLARISRGARVLFSGAGYSKASWGFQPSGLSYREWQQLEIAATNAAGFNSGRCRYSALCIAYGPTGLPFVRAMLFVLWFKLIIPAIHNNQPIVQKIPIAWNTIKTNLSNADITLEIAYTKQTAYYLISS